MIRATTVDYSYFLHTQVSPNLHAYLFISPYIQAKASQWSWYINDVAYFPRWL